MSGDPAEVDLLVSNELEQALLAAVLAENAAYDLASAKGLRAEHFFEPVHGAIYQACGALIEMGGIANAMTLAGRFGQDKDLEAAGGVQYLADLQGNYVSLINAGHYAESLIDYAQRRRLVAIASVAHDSAHNHERPLKYTRAAIEQQLADLEGVSAEARCLPLIDAGPSAMAALEEARKRHQEGRAAGLSTGLIALDSLLGGGPRAGEMVVIAGATGMGKSALATGMALTAARAGEIAVYFSAEMTTDQLTHRIWAFASGVDLQAMRRGSLDEHDLEQIADAKVRLGDPPLLFDQTAQMTLASIRSRCRRVKQSVGLGAVFVDYLQLIRSGRTDRVNELAEITAGLKRLAREMEVPLYALSQLSRQHASRDDKRPQLSDLRESGSIEQDADAVIFVYRPHYYLTREKPKDPSREMGWRADCDAVRTKAELIVAKQRQGATGTVDCYFDAATTAFSDDGQGVLV